MESTNQEMQRVLDLQKQAFIKNGPPSNKLRIDRMQRLKSMIMENKVAFVDAMNEDFGVRSKNASYISDIYGVIPSLSDAIKKLPKWNKNEKRKANSPFNLFGAKAYIQHEPLGTIGMITPWNFPVYLTFTPLAGIFAAGNSVMHKPSEHSPITSNLMKELCDAAFDETEFATFLGGPDVGSAFTELHFDHLLYTGSGNVAKYVMQGASKNLVPVTLELGGKSPVIVGKSADIDATAKRVMFGKTLNAGQICLAPDYVMVHSSKKDEFIESTKEAVKEYFPTMKDNDDYSSVINENHFNRLNGLLDDAREKGATIEPINPANEDFNQQEFYKIPPTLVLNTTDDMRIMKEEIFGPLMPVREFESLEEPISFINNYDKPLGLYYFGKDKKEESEIMDKTTSGGVTINNVMGHIQQGDLPFGGVGASGTGRYEGYDGFLNFSNPRAVYKDISTKLDKLYSAIRPPYQGDIEKVLQKLLK
ncbi:MAG: coniferyl aldehyde dehydrogenase [Gammaproteobacteria bacterium]